MDLVYSVLTVFHFIGWAIVFGGYIASVRTPGLYRGVFHGAATAVVAGIGMVGVLEASDTSDAVNHAKIGVKLTIAVIIAVLAWVAARQGRAKDNGTGPVSPGIKHAIGGLTLANIVIAVVW